MLINGAPRMPVVSAAISIICALLSACSTLQPHQDLPPLPTLQHLGTIQAANTSSVDRRYLYCSIGKSCLEPSRLDPVSASSEPVTQPTIPSAPDRTSIINRPITTSLFADIAELRFDFPDASSRLTPEDEAQIHLWLLSHNDSAHRYFVVARTRMSSPALRKISRDRGDAVATAIKRDGPARRVDLITVDDPNSVQIVVTQNLVAALRKPTSSISTSAVPLAPPPNVTPPIAEGASGVFP